MANETTVTGLATPTAQHRARGDSVRERLMYWYKRLDEIGQEMAKRITGHRTDTIFNQYNQVSLDQLRGAVRRVEKHVDAVLQDKQTAQEPCNSQELQAMPREEVMFSGPQNLNHVQRALDKASKLLRFLRSLRLKLSRKGVETSGTKNNRDGFDDTHGPSGAGGEKGQR